MVAADLIAYFDGHTKLHIEIKEVLAQVRAGAPSQSIEFYEERDDQPDVLRGLLVQDWIRVGWGDEDQLVSWIIYNGNMDKSWGRLVVCKELIHILDPDYALTNTRDDVRNLIDRMAVPMDLQGFSHQEFGDRVAEFQALAVLFPRASRQLLLAPYLAKTLSAKEISALAGIPDRYIGFLMSDSWLTMYNVFSKT